jgi:hypothetical protein
MNSVAVGLEENVDGARWNLMSQLMVFMTTIGIYIITHGLKVHAIET